MHINAKPNRLELIIWGSLSCLITIPIFIKGIEFNALEVLLIPIGLCISPIACTQSFSKRSANKPLFILTTVVFSLFLTYILIGLLYTYSATTVFKVFFKWSEIFSIAIFIFFYINSRKRFSAIYWLLFFTNLALVAKAVISMGFHESHILTPSRIRIGVSTVFAIVLLFPFATQKKARVSIFLLILILILSQSRASWIEFIVAFILFAYHAKDNRKLFRNATISILLLTSCLLLIPGVRGVIYQRISHLGVLDEKPAFSTYQRLYRLEACYLAFLDRPCLGVGAGNIFYHTDKMDKARILDWARSNNKKSITPHNVYAQYLAEIGLIGFAFFISLLFLLYKIIAFVRHKKEFSNDPEALGIYLYFAVFLVFLAFGYVAGADRIILGIYFGLILAMLKWPLFHTNSLPIKLHEEIK